MSIFSKKFDELLLESSEIEKLNSNITKLEQRIIDLEATNASLKNLSVSLMSTIKELTKGYINNRTAIEELYNYLTNPEHPEDSTSETEEAQILDDLNNYKKMLN